MRDNQNKTRQPNVILINCDDLGYGDLACYGFPCNDTPHVDQLALEGMRFTDFYMASPVCSASRVAMLTGCYSQRIGLADYQVLFPGQAQGLNPKESTFAKQLKQVGYDTKIIGKWHCGDQPEFLPTHHGFDEYFGIPCGAEPHRNRYPRSGRVREPQTTDRIRCGSSLYDRLLRSSRHADYVRRRSNIYL